MILRALTNTRRKTDDRLFKAIALPVLMIIALLFLLCYAESARAFNPVEQLFAYNYGIDDGKAQELRDELSNLMLLQLHLDTGVTLAVKAKDQAWLGYVINAKVVWLYTFSELFHEIVVFVKNHRGI